MKKIIILLLLLTFLVYPASADIWQTDSDIINGLTVVGILGNHPTIFNDSGTWKMISGETTGNFYGSTWNGTAWEVNSSVINGLSNTGPWSRPTTFYNGDVLSLIITIEDNTISGYNWTGTTWQSDPAIVNGLPFMSSPTPEIFYEDGILKMIVGTWSSGYSGYQWNGTGWESDANIINGLINDGWVLKPAVFNHSGTLKLITGSWSGGFYGYRRIDSGWESYPAIVSGIVIDGTYTAPETFYMDDNWYLISGEGANEPNGFILNENSITSNLKTEHVVNNHQIRTNITAPYFTWDYSDPEDDEQTSWQIQVGTTQGATDKWNSGVMSGTDTFDIYAGTSLELNIIYYVQVRTNDGGSWSAWTEGTFMTVPNIVSGTITNSTGPLVGANVTIVGIGSNTTNATGHYYIPDVPEDTYTITATSTNHNNYSDSITVSGNTIENIVMSNHTTIILDKYTIKVLTAQNTALQIMNVSFGDVYAGNTETLNQSFNLTNIGNIEAAVSATFSSNYGGIYGLTNSPYVIGGSNVSMQKDGGTFTALNNLVTDSIMTDTVTDDSIAYNWNIKTTFPAGQDAAGYSGTIELTFSNN